MNKLNLKNSLIILILFALIIGLFYFGLKPNKDPNLHKEEMKTAKILKTMEQKDINEVSVAVRDAKKTIQLNNASSTNESMAIRFSNSVIMGDSIAMGLVEYQLLSPSVVIGARGRRVDNCDDDINKVISLAPQSVFVCFGLNDLPYYRGNVEPFINNYGIVMDKLKKGLPNAKLYINAILPVASYVAGERPAYASLQAFNDAIKEMCKTKKITYIDNSFLLQGDDVYIFDGIHPQFFFFPKWMANMAMIGKL
ncbi:MAG: GDSL-type esterase/lipase family protein [Erysipelotrichaceae bacterium]